MRVELDRRKSVNENAAFFYEKSKKLKRKIPGLLRAIEETRVRLARHKKISEEKESVLERLRPEWFEKFRWCFCDGFLALAGRDAKQNELLVKKHVESGDVFLHADVVGAPSTVLKTNGKQVPESVLEEAAVFAASFSSAWARGFGGVDVYWVLGDQVSLSAPVGEYRPRGGVMVRGERRFLKAVLGLAFGVEEGKNGARMVVGPEGSVRRRCGRVVFLVPGSLKKSELAKRIREWGLRKLGSRFSRVLDLDELLRILPNGESDLVFE